MVKREPARTVSLLPRDADVARVVQELGVALSQANIFVDEITGLKYKLAVRNGQVVLVRVN